MAEYLQDSLTLDDFPPWDHHTVTTPPSGSDDDTLDDLPPMDYEEPEQELDFLQSVFEPWDDHANATPSLGSSKDGSANPPPSHPPADAASPSGSYNEEIEQEPDLLQMAKNQFLREELCEEVRACVRMVPAIKVPKPAHLRGSASVIKAAKNEEARSEKKRREEAKQQYNPRRGRRNRRRKKNRRRRPNKTNADKNQGKSINRHRGADRGLAAKTEQIIETE